MEVKFIVKEVYRHTAACDACKVRKRKCDGVAPCKYCVSKNIKCEFSQQKKRGPSKKPKPEKDNKSPIETKPTTTIIPNDNISKSGVVKVNNSNSSVSTIGTLTEGDNIANMALQVARESLATSVIDKEMLNTLELNHYIDLYTRFVTNVVPGCNVQSLISPSSIAHKLQSYAAMAFAARSIGDYTKAKLFISQGRVLAGSIFDSPDLDTVVGMIMMGNYWQMSLNLPLSGHYANLAWSLFKLLRRPDYRVQLCCQVNYIMSDANTNDDGKSELLLNAARSLRAQGNAPDALPSLLLSLSAKVVPLFGSTMFFPHNMPNIFQIFREVFITEEERGSIMEDLCAIEKVMVRQTFYISAKDAVHPYLLQVKLYQTIIEWKSNHVDAAFAQALQSWEICKKMQSAKILGVTCDFPHLCLLAGLADFFKEMNQLGHALHVCNLLRQICNLMGPDYDFAAECVEDFTRVNAINDYELANHSDNESLSSESSPYGSPFHTGFLDSPKRMDQVSSFHSPSPSPSPSAGLDPYSSNFSNSQNSNFANFENSGTQQQNPNSTIVFDANELLRFEDNLSFIINDENNINNNITNNNTNNNNNNNVNNPTITNTSTADELLAFVNKTSGTTDEILSFSGGFTETLNRSLSGTNNNNNNTFNQNNNNCNNNNTPATNTNDNNNNNNNSNNNTYNNPLSNSALFANTDLDAAISEVLNDPSLYPSFDSSLPLSSDSSFAAPANAPPTNTNVNNNTNNDVSNTNNANANGPFNQIFDFGTLNDSGNFFNPPDVWDFSSLPPSTPKV
eukprot:Phypoly_transcript_03228.p1 GENE.Phypoly_transcript_03228~~Phypoly_transcript_03228.p1  ORF type:complete len:816 (+),score=189.11 Phypoly_transcript_03228:74-2449(+)